MSNRLLSLLTEIERALIANDSSPEGGTWDTLRLINFRQGLARLTLSVRSAAGVTATRGTILLQGFTLADGALCLKANLSWTGTDNTSVYAIYAKPDLNWRGEAAQIAVKWLDGQLALTEAQAAAGHGENSELAATG